MKKLVLASGLVLLGGLVAASTACSKPAAKHSKTAKIQPKSGSKLGGTVELTEKKSGGVEVVVTVHDAPAGVHGVHIHQKGDCSGADGKTAGGHFNPEGHKHGLPTEAEHHLGDLGNITIDAKGQGRLSLFVKGANLTAGDAKSFLGRALIIHAKKDDGGQPTGNAGARLGCASIPAK